MTPPASPLHVLRGGEGHGDRLLVLIHGMGAHNAAWLRLAPYLDTHWPGRWLAPSLRGHGESLHRTPYSFGTFAADIATLIADERAAHPTTSVSLVGHSFGGIVAALIATGWYGVGIDRMFCFSTKFTWEPSEIARFHAIAKKPVPVTTRAEALERSLKYSGLGNLVAPDSPEALAGIEEVDGGYRIRMDPRAFAAMGPDIASVFRNVEIPYGLAAGHHDPLAKLWDLQGVHPGAFLFDLGDHNAHVEHPEMVWRAIAAELLPERSAVK